MITAAKHSQRLKTMSAQAQKVFAAVPIAQPWSVTYILSELQRLGHSLNEHRLVMGCLKSLVEAGLITETAPCLFVRVPVKPESVPVQTSLKVSMSASKLQAPVSASKPAEAVRTPITVLSELSGRANALSAMAAQLASDLESAVIEVMAFTDANDGELAGLRQLKKLLKDLG